MRIACCMCADLPLQHVEIGSRNRHYRHTVSISDEFTSMFHAETASPRLLILSPCSVRSTQNSPEMASISSGPTALWPSALDCCSPKCPLALCTEVFLKLEVDHLMWGTYSFHFPGHTICPVYPGFPHKSPEG